MGQRLLTCIGQVCVGDGAPDARQRLVDGERVGDVLRSLKLEIVVADAANENE